MDNHPPIKLKPIEKINKIGKKIIAPIIFGRTKNVKEFTPMISSASICSVTRIVPISEAIFEPIFPAKIKEIIVGENSSIVLDRVIYPIVYSGKKGEVIFAAVCKAITPPIKVDNKATIGIELIPIFCISSNMRLRKILPFWGLEKIIPSIIKYFPMLLSIFIDVAKLIDIFMFHIHLSLLFCFCTNFLNIFIQINRVSKEKAIQIFSKYIPQDFVVMISDLYLSSHVKFKIVKPRSTKLGDFRNGTKDQLPQITINGNLNPYAFLITTLHEFAHLQTYNKFGRKVLPHGEEWKNNFRILLLPIIKSNKLPKDIENALVNSLVKTKASSCSDIQLSRALKNYDLKSTSTTRLEDIPKNTKFILNNRAFIKGELRRTRYLCTDNKNKSFLIHALAEIELI
jgi:SprT protein